LGRVNAGEIDTDVALVSDLGILGMGSGIGLQGKCRWIQTLSVPPGDTAADGTIMPVIPR